MICKILQGSVLPHLFSIFINDLDKDKDSILIKFTDSIAWDRIANMRDVRMQV